MTVDSSTCVATKSSNENGNDSILPLEGLRHYVTAILMLVTRIIMWTANVPPPYEPVQFVHRAPTLQEQRHRAEYAP